MRILREMLVDTWFFRRFYYPSPTMKQGSHFLQLFFFKGGNPRDLVELTCWILGFIEYISLYNWLVVWNMFYFSIQLGIIIPTDDLSSFFRGVGIPTTNQIIINHHEPSSLTIILTIINSILTVYSDELTTEILPVSTACFGHRGLFRGHEEVGRWTVARWVRGEKPMVLLWKTTMF